MNYHELETFDLKKLNQIAQKCVFKSLNKPHTKKDIEEKVMQAFESVRTLKLSSDEKYITTKDFKQFLNQTITEKFDSKLKVQDEDKLEHIIKQNIRLSAKDLEQVTEDFIKISNQSKLRMSNIGPNSSIKSVNLDLILENELLNVPAEDNEEII